MGKNTLENIDLQRYREYRAMGVGPSAAAGAARRHTPGPHTGPHLGVGALDGVDLSYHKHDTYAEAPANEVPGLVEWCAKYGFDPEWVAVRVSASSEDYVDITEQVPECGFVLEKVAPRNWRDSDYAEYPTPPVPWAVKIDYSGPQDRTNPMWLYASEEEHYTPLTGMSRGHQELRRNEMLRALTERHAEYIAAVLRGDVTWHSVDVKIMYDDTERGVASLGMCEYDYRCQDVNPTTGRRYCFNEMVWGVVNDYGLLGDALVELVKWADARPGRVASRDVVREQVPLFPGAGLS